MEFIFEKDHEIKAASYKGTNQDKKPQDVKVARLGVKSKYHRSKVLILTGIRETKARRL